MNMFWRGSTLDSRIFPVMVIKSVMTVMSWMSSISIAGMSLVQIAISSVSREVMFIKLICSSFMIMLSDQM